MNDFAYIISHDPWEIWTIFVPPTSVGFSKSTLQLGYPQVKLYVERQTKREWSGSKQNFFLKLSEKNLVL